MKPIPRLWHARGQISLSLALFLLVVVTAGSGLARASRGLSARVGTAVAQDSACSAAFVEFRRPHSQSDSVRNLRAHECADGVDDSRRAFGMRLLASDQMRLAMTHSMIPEYHDEQRLPDGSGGLGPRAAIYASSHLDDFRASWQFAAHPAPGVLVAYVVVEKLPFEVIPPTYTALGLKEGMHCVYLQHGGGANWRAVVHAVTAGQACARGGGGGTPLMVRAQSYGGASIDAYPPVARFSLSRGGAPLLGVRCLNAWCEIGAPELGGPFQVHDPLPMDLGVPASNYNRVKGWHDEQFLSIRSGNSWRPTPIRAAIVPATDVGDLPESAFIGTWIRVAMIYLDNDPPAGTKYHDWGLRGGRIGNLVELQLDGAGKWQARMTSSAGRFDWFAGKREMHHDVGIPGTVRFRWTILDDAIWTPCGQACCRVEGY